MGEGGAITGFMLYAARRLSAAPPGSLAVDDDACATRGAQWLEAWRRLSPDARARFEADAASVTARLAALDEVTQVEARAAALEGEQISRKRRRLLGIVPALPHDTPTS